MLTPRQLIAVGAAGAVATIAFGVPILQNVLIEVPRSRVAACKAVVSHTYFLHVTLESGAKLVLQQEDVPNPAACIAPGSVLEKARGEFGYRINGRVYFWESQVRRTFAALAVVGLLVAASTIPLLKRLNQ